VRQALPILALVAAGWLTPAGPAAADPAAHLAGGVTTYTVIRGDTWTSIGARFGVYPSTLAADNHVDLRRPLAIGLRLRIDNQHIVPAGVDTGTITVNVPQRMLFYRDEADLLAYPVAVGRPTWQTPASAFTVVRQEENPTWHVPASILAESARAGHTQPPVVPPGPTNPLGRFWIGLSAPGIGIHGTPLESSIYQTATHGCIRLQHDNIASLFARVEVGTHGRIIYEPILLTESGGDVYVEVHADVYHRLAETPQQVVRALAQASGLTDRIDWMLVDLAVEARAGVARRVTVTASMPAPASD
jgi:L,D-transpeptidase ErfK/SrfK